MKNPPNVKPIGPLFAQRRPITNCDSCCIDGLPFAIWAIANCAR